MKSVVHPSAHTNTAPLEDYNHYLSTTNYNYNSTPTVRLIRQDDDCYDNT